MRLFFCECLFELQILINLFQLGASDLLGTSGTDRHWNYRGSRGWSVPVTFLCANSWVRGLTRLALDSLMPGFHMIASMSRPPECRTVGAILAIRGFHMIARIVPIARVAAIVRKYRKEYRISSNKRLGALREGTFFYWRWWAGAFRVFRLFLTLPLGSAKEKHDPSQKIT